MAGAAEDVVVRVRGTEKLGDDGDVALGYPLIGEGDRRKPAAAVGYPLPPERGEPRSPSATRRPPSHHDCASRCEMFGMGFIVTFGLVLVTDFSLIIFLHKDPNPLLVLLCLPFIAAIFAGLFVLMVLYCAASSNLELETQLDLVGVEKVIGLFGFSLFGSLSLLPSTVDHAKDDKNITITNMTILVLSFSLIWVLASVELLCGVHGKSNFEHMLCTFTSPLGILGLTLLVILHIIWMFANDTLATLFFFIFRITIAILHIMSWVMSYQVGEDKVEEIATPEKK